VDNVQSKHSKLGIASFGLSCLNGILILLIFIVAGLIENATPGGLDDESVAAMLIGLVIIALFFSQVISLGLGVASFFQPNTKKVFGILGVCFSVSVVVITVILIGIGIAIG
jgi:hypothetical protein